MGSWVALFLFFTGTFSPPLAPSPFAVQNFTGTVYLYSQERKTWLPPQRGARLKRGDEILTGPDGSLDLYFGKSHIRIKENSEFYLQAPKKSFGRLRERIRLQRGAVLVSSKQQELEIAIPGPIQNPEQGFLYDFAVRLSAASSRGTFLAVSIPEEELAWISVLEGRVRVNSPLRMRSVEARPLQKVESKGVSPVEAVSFSQTDWNQVREAYDFTSKGTTEP